MGKRPLVAVVRGQEKDSQLFLSFGRGSRSDISRPSRDSHRFGQELTPKRSTDGQPGENGTATLRRSLANKQDLLNSRGTQEVQVFGPVPAEREGVRDQRPSEVILEQIPTDLEVRLELRDRSVGH